MAQSRQKRPSRRDAGRTCCAANEKATGGKTNCQGSDTVPDGGPRVRELRMTTTVPAIEISGFAEGDEVTRAAIAKSVSSALSEIGFLVLRGHGVSSTTISETRDVAFRFFDLSLLRRNALGNP